MSAIEDTWSASAWFPLAGTFGEPPFEVRELPPGVRALGFTERHQQCVWTDDRLRPARLQTAGGEA